MNGNGELTETEKVFFYVSYGVLTEFLRMNVILRYFCNGQRRYGDGGTDTRRWKPRIRLAGHLVSHFGARFIYFL